ncbi:unnamed protein product [Brachionus calyciflorus]|uniref:Uncharacterized protein n=1 Tax=Brachionus calyciflorus TaxID=104777 RepID=A0A813M212_9BILA|nr:unnamed protein product [Brachionus calyciflorus]
MSKSPGSVTITKNEEKVERFINHNFEINHDKFDKIKQIQSKFKVSYKNRCETEPIDHKKMLMDKDISLDTYVKYTMEIFDLSRLSKKKQKFPSLG